MSLINPELFCLGLLDLADLADAFLKGHLLFRSCDGAPGVRTNVLPQHELTKRVMVSLTKDAK